MTEPNEILYPGTELELFTHARNWRHYWMTQIEPFLGNRVLEVGAGIGSITRELAKGHKGEWLAVEPDPTLANQMRSALDGEALANVTVIQGDLGSIKPDEAPFNSILYSDVMEHIQDDRLEIERALSKLESKGYLILLVPAHQFLFSDFDKAIGHHRRYNMRMLRALTPNSASIVLARYLDCVGVTLSLGNRLITRKDAPTIGQIDFWDRTIVPVSKILDPLFRYRLGKSVLFVLQKK